MSSKKTKWFTLEPLKELPPTKRERASKYDELVNEILSTKEKYVKVKVPEINYKSLYSILAKRLKGKPIKLHVREESVIVEKLE
jgi:hypothetical protein